LKNEFQKPKKIKRITIKSPSIPLFQRGKLISPPFGNLFPVKDRQREAGRDFQSAKVLQKLQFEYQSTKKISWNGRSCPWKLKNTNIQSSQ
jgi:hypothetical protein